MVGIGGTLAASFLGYYFNRKNIELQLLANKQADQQAEMQKQQEQGGGMGDYGNGNGDNSPAGEESGSSDTKEKEKKGDELFTNETRKSLAAFGKYTDDLERKLHIVID